MPKHYKEMIDEIINKMDEDAKFVRGPRKKLPGKLGKALSKFKVKFAYKPSDKIAVANYDKMSDAMKFINDVKNKGGKAILPTEDAPANNTSGTDMNPTGARMSPKMMKRKKEQGDEQDDITKKISKMIKQNEDNNNVILKQVNESLSKVEDKSDEKLGLKQDVDVVEKEYITFRDKYNA